MTHEPSQEIVWSQPFSVQEIPAGGVDVTVSADKATLARLAEANSLVALASAQARLHVTRRGREGAHVAGELRARATQMCSVTLEPFETEIVEPIDVEFAPAARPQPERKPRPGDRDGRREIEDAMRGRTPHRGRNAPEPEPEDEAGMDDLDAPDPIIGGKIDLGALASEFLTLGVDPYPRKPGVVFEGDDPAGARPSAFAGLAGLGRKADEQG